MATSTSVKAKPAKPNPRLYRSPDGDEIRVPLPDGRLAVVGAEWRKLELDFHNAAVREGCEVKAEGGAGNGSGRVKEPAAGDRASGAPQVGSDEAVRTGLLTMLNRDEPGDFVEATGLPALKVLSKLCGFAVAADQASRVLRALKAEADAAAGDEVNDDEGGESVGGDANDDPAALIDEGGKKKTKDEVDAKEAMRNKRRATATKAAKQAARSGQRRSASSA